MKDVQCYELFGGIALKNHAFLFISCYFNLIKRPRLSNTPVSFLGGVLSVRNDTEVFESFGRFIGL